MEERTIKCVIVGDGTVGKTCLAMRYAFGDLSALERYIPTVLDSCNVRLSFRDEPVMLTLWDTGGQETYARLRPIAYANTDVFLVCYAVDNFTSYENARDLWVPEVRHYCPNAQILLVGTKTDVRSDIIGSQAIGRRILLRANGEVMAKGTNVEGYMECSALTGEGVKEVFDAAVRLGLAPKKRRRNHVCRIM